MLLEVLPLSGVGNLSCRFPVTDAPGYKPYDSDSAQHARNLRIPAPRFWLVFWQLPGVLALHWYFSFCILAYLSVCSDAQIGGDYA